MTKNECLERLEKIIESSCTYDYCEFEMQVNEWKKGDKDRTYFAIVEKSANSKSSKHYVKKEYGYYDNTANEYISGKNDLTNNYNFGGNKF